MSQKFYNDEEELFYNIDNSFNKTNDSIKIVPNNKEVMPEPVTLEANEVTSGAQPVGEEHYDQIEVDQLVETVDETMADKGFIKVTVYKKNFIHH